MTHSCSEPFYDHATTHFAAKAKLVRMRTQAVALADASLRGHGTRKKLNSPSMNHLISYFICKRSVAQISFSLPENVLDKSKASLQAITKLACGSNSCNR
jgi:hypothetical protein